MVRAATETETKTETEALLAALVPPRWSVLGGSRAGRPIVGALVAGRRAAPAAPTATAPAHAPADAGPDRRAHRLLVVGGVHGNEPSSVAAVAELLDRLRPEATPWELVVVVPALNPDGLAAGRKNTITDVDLNRNFPAGNFTRAHSPGYDPGPSPLSEPESALLAALCEAHDVDAAIAVHAPFACVNYDGPARAWAERVARACEWPVRESIGYPTPGSFGSWLGVDRKVPVLTIELPPGPFGDFRAAAAAGLDAAIGWPPPL